MARDLPMKRIQILGPGCPKCRRLAKNAQTAAADLAAEGAGEGDSETPFKAVVEKVTDIMEITASGAMLTPALVVDGEIRAMGNVPSVDEIKEMLSS